MTTDHIYYFKPDTAVETGYAVMDPVKFLLNFFAQVNIHPLSVFTV